VKHQNKQRSEGPASLLAIVERFVRELCWKKRCFLFTSILSQLVRFIGAAFNINTKFKLTAESRIIHKTIITSILDKAFKALPQSIYRYVRAYFLASTFI